MDAKATNRKAIRMALIERGLRQYELAARLGVDPNRISALMHDRLDADDAAVLRRRVEQVLDLPAGTADGTDA